MPDTNVHDVTGEGPVAETPAPAPAEARHHLKEIRSLRFRVRIAVYPAILILLAIDYFVLGFTPLQTFVTAIAGLSIAILSTETAFARGFQLHKRTRYPRAVMEELGTINGVSEAGDRTLEVVRQLLDVQASFIIIPGGDDWILSISGMSRDSAGQLIEAGMQAIGEATRTRMPVQFNPASGRRSETEISGQTRLVFIPMVALQEPIGVLAVAGDKGNRDLNDNQLLSSIGVAVGFSLENLRQKELIRHLAYHDGLTNLPNRMLFEDRLSVALAQARRRKQMVAVMFVDMDRFKVVNDTVGHALGDRLLKDIAERLSGLVRDGDTVARMGGDEFTILLADGSGLVEAAEVAERILDACRRPWPLDAREFRVTASIGIAMYPNDAEDVESLIRNADAAMYRAKNQGGDAYHFYTPAMNATIGRRVVLESDLRRALDRREFVVHYQPQVNIDTGQVVGMEALVRWQHPERGVVLPADFIGVAEETGLIVQLGEWVLRSACSQLKAWQQLGLPPVRVAVNLSARQFQLRDLKNIVALALEETGLDPHCLHLEITESVAMQDAEYTISLLRELREMGVQIAIDDFGTGHSSLSYLTRFPIDVLKIDRSFVTDLTTDPNDAAIASTIIAMAHNLNLKVIAEGVETKEQLAILWQHQCDEMQGYLFSKPVPAEEAETILRRHQRRPLPRVRAGQ